MRKDFQEVKRDSLIDEIVKLVEYAEGEVETNEDGIGREYADVNVNWADESIVRILLRTMLSRYDVLYRKDETTMARAEKVFALVRGEERKDLMCFTFGLFLNRMTQSDLDHMIAWVKKTRQWKREIEEEEKVASVSDVMFETVKKGESIFGKLASPLKAVTKKIEEEK